MSGTSITIWVVVILAIIAKRYIVKLTARRLTGRTLFWKVRVEKDLRLRARGKRLRLYGIVAFDDRARVDEAVAVLTEAIHGRRVRLRVVGRDADGALVVVLRCGGASPALALLRTGLVATPFTAARAYREALIWARCRGRGNWRVIDKWPPGFVGWTVQTTPALKYLYE